MDFQLISNEELESIPIKRKSKNTELSNKKGKSEKSIILIDSDEGEGEAEAEDVSGGSDIDLDSNNNSLIGIKRGEGSFKIKEWEEYEKKNPRLRPQREDGRQWETATGEGGYYEQT